jgi:hypothetical protein
VADIVRQHRAQLEAQVQLTVPQRRALSAIALCRTAPLGGHLERCVSCGYEHAAYNSCRNRHCPKCQALAQEQWVAARSERILPVPHFHVVFTLPGQLRALARFRPKLIYGALFHAASQTLLELGESHFHARLGITMVLHTWTRELRLHPHVHAIVTCGGLHVDADHWVACSRKYLFPVQVMGELLRGKMMAAIKHMHTEGELDGFEDFDDPEGFGRLMCALKKHRWVVYAKKPFRRADHVLRYLGRYTHRVAISNSRLLDVTDELVTFRTKNGRTACIPPVEFLRRFVKHVLPDGFVKIRHYGLYSGANVNNQLPKARRLIAPDSPPCSLQTTALSSWIDQLQQLTGRNVRRCPRCAGEMIEAAKLPRSTRPPP